ncbi:hypothetical protein Bca52824_019205 [Brassica carinata]|uniref:Ubiquitin-like protease family profile domain-containing protein n=1 Tax=Brassica carinata TaxID=52824 RepID=A0A8X7VQC0_BRACI|nr:hypothetical protein Bca52824_019205 [Brassica carinata]
MQIGRHDATEIFSSNRKTNPGTIPGLETSTCTCEAVETLVPPATFSFSSANPAELLHLDLREMERQRRRRRREEEELLPARAKVGKFDTKGKIERMTDIIKRLKPSPPKIKDPVAWLVHKLKQRSFDFVASLFHYNWWLSAIPQLLDFIPAPPDQRTLMDLQDPYLPQHGSINALDIRRVEFSKNDFPAKHHSGLDHAHDKPLHIDPTTNQDVDAMDSRIHDEPQSPIISQYAAHLHLQTTGSMTPPPDASENETIHNQTGHDVDATARTPNSVHNSVDHSSDNDQVEPVSEMMNDEHNSEDEQDVDDMDHESEDVHNSGDNKSNYDEVEPDDQIKNDGEAIDQMSTTLAVRIRTWKMSTTLLSTTTMSRNNCTIQVMMPPPMNLVARSRRLAHEEPNQKTTEPTTPVTPLTRGPIFDSTARPSSPPGTRGRLSPPPFTPLKSPVKSNGSGIGFASHTATHNAFTATASSNSPRYVPSHLENLLAKELFESKLIPRWISSYRYLTGVRVFPSVSQTPPQCVRCSNTHHPHVQFKFFYIMYHSTPSGFEFSNKSLLEIAAPKQWTTAYVTNEILVHMLSARHHEILQTEKAAFVPPTLCSLINNIFEEFSRSKKKNTFVWDERLVDIVCCPGKKWMEDIHTIYTPMLWNQSHWVGLAINLDMGLVEVLDPLPALHGVRRMAKWMKPVLSILLTLSRKLQFPRVAAHGDPARDGGITDQIVDNLRKRYAMDIYKTMVLPRIHAIRSLMTRKPPLGTRSPMWSNSARQTTGIPTRCWCGADLTTFGAQTKDNLFRRFYRCEIDLKRKTEHHLFKWVDEAIVDEINMVDAKHSKLKEDLDSFKLYTTRRLENQSRQLDQLRSQMEPKPKMSASIEESTLTTQESPMVVDQLQHPAINIAIAALALGTMAWLYGKFSN